MPDYDAALMASSGLVQKDRIQILLAEYAALRAEIVGRTGFGFQTAAVGLAGLTWFLQQTLSGRAIWFWVAMAFVGFGFCIAVFVNLRDLGRAAERLKQIELEVNSRAGEHLLVWETLSGILTRAGPIAGFFTLAPPLSRDKLPPLKPEYLLRQREADSSKRDG
jgi:hypothetical protein